MVGTLGSHIGKHSIITHPLATTIHTYTHTAPQADLQNTLPPSPQIVILCSTGSQGQNQMIDTKPRYG